MLDLKIEIEKFRSWADDYPQENRSGEWECDYPNWREIQDAFEDFIDKKEGPALKESEIVDLIYIVARDNEVQDLIRFMVENCCNNEFVNIKDNKKINCSLIEITEAEECC